MDKLVQLLAADFGAKNNFIRYLINVSRANLTRMLRAIDIPGDGVDGPLLSNGTGHPEQHMTNVVNFHEVIQQQPAAPRLGTCTGNQLGAVAAGSKTYRRKVASMI